MGAALPKGRQGGGFTEREGLRPLRRDWAPALEVSVKAMCGTELKQGDPLAEYLLGLDRAHPRRLELLRFLAILIFEESLLCGGFGLELYEGGRLAAVCLGTSSANGSLAAWRGRAAAWLLRRKWARRLPRGPEAEELLLRAFGPNGLASQLEWRREKYAAEPHLSIPLMMVEPRLQGQKLCSQLMRAMCCRADEAQLPCYLETGGARNAAIYQRFGFQVLDHFDVGVEVFTLWRPRKGL